jgi:hypothetical protein
MGWPIQGEMRGALYASTLALTLVAPGATDAGAACPPDSPIKDYVLGTQQGLTDSSNGLEVSNDDRRHRCPSSR